MKLRYLFAYAAGIAGFASLAAAPASASVAVISNGDMAQSCFHAAEFPDTNTDSIATCTAALNSQPMSASDRAATLVNRGILYAHSGRLSAAISDYDASLKLDPQIAEAYVNRGVAFMTQKRYEAALADFNKSLALGAREPEITLYNRAYVRESLGNIRGAYQDYKKAVEIRPGFALATEQLRRFKVVRKHDTDGA